MASDGTRLAGLGCQASCNVAGPLLSIISCPPTARSRGGVPAADFGRIHFGDDNDESKAASGGRRRNRKMRWGWCGCAVESFSEAADGDHVVASA